MSSAYFMSASFSSVGGVLRRTGRTEIDSPPQEGQRAALVEQVVEVPALRALHARGAAVRAGAARDQLRGVARPALELLEAALGDPDAAGVPVVDEDGRAARLRVYFRRQAADVPSVAHRPQ